MNLFDLKKQLKIYKIFSLIISILCIVALLMIISSRMTVNRLSIEKMNEPIVSNTSEYSNLYLINEINVLKDEINELKNSSVSVESGSDVELSKTIDNSNEITVEDIAAEVDERNISYDITEISGLTVDEYNLIINQSGFTDGSILYNIGESLYTYENLNKVNGIYILAVAMKMTENGENEKLINTNNLFGLYDSVHKKYRSFESVDDSINYFSQLMRIYYFDKHILDINSIAIKYVPRSSTKWKNSVTSNIESIKGIIESME